MTSPLSSWLYEMPALRPLVMDYDGYERHRVTEMFLSDSPVERVLDVGGYARVLDKFVPYRTTAINIDGSGDVRYDGKVLPFADDAFDAVVSLDTIEHMPRDERGRFLDECLRVARRYLLVAAPYGTEEHRDSEARLNELYRSVHGEPHRHLDEHVRFGIPTPSEVESFSHRFRGHVTELCYAGDFEWQCRAFERSLCSGESRGIASLVGKLRIRWGARAFLRRIVLRREPYDSANRFYLFVRKG